MRILLVITGHTIEPVRSLFENTDVHFKAATGDALLVPYAVCEGAPAPDLKAFDGIIMTGSAAMVSDNLTWIKVAKDLAAKCLSDEIPFLGVCFGHQILGSVLGAQVGPNPNGRRNGTTLVEIQHLSAIFEGLPKSFYAQVSHRDVVLESKPTFDVIASSQHDPRHAISAGKCAFGVQFHPEWTMEVSRAYIDARETTLGQETASRMRETLQASPYASKVLQNFVSVCLKAAPNRAKNAFL